MQPSHQRRSPLRRKRKSNYSRKFFMDEMTPQVLRMFVRFNKESLDLHELFEAGGNDPEERKRVFFTVERMVEDGLLEERGNDFYSLTDSGREAAKAIPVEPETEEGEVGYF